LANACRGREAADEYLAAAGLSQGAVANELRRQAAEQLFASGHTNEGMAVFREVLTEVGIKMPAGMRAAVNGLLLERFRCRLRLFVNRSSQSAAIDRQLAAKVDACWVATSGLLFIDSLLAAYFNAKGLRLAQSSGDPLRIGRALAFEAVFWSSMGGWCDRVASRYMRRDEKIAEQTRLPRLASFNSFIRGLMQILKGSWRDGLDYLQRAESINEQHGIRDVWYALMLNERPIGQRSASDECKRWQVGFPDVWTTPSKARPARHSRVTPNLANRTCSLRSTCRNGRGKICDTACSAGHRIRCGSNI
jgi:hypothetical protein